MYNTLQSRIRRKPLRSREFEKEKKIEKNSKIINWYKGKDGKSFDSVLMIPATPNGELKKVIQEIAKSSNLRVKIVEKSGTKLGTYLRKFDKTKSKGPCQEKDCMICQHTTKFVRKCRIPSLVYKITCKECEKLKIKANYYGESSFNGYTRGVQHLENYRSKSKKTQEKSALRQHAKDHHNDRKVDFQMTVLETFKKNPLARQVLESIWIVKSKTEDDIPMNNKNEFNQALIVTAKYTKGVFAQ